MNLNRHTLKVLRERTALTRAQLADRAGVDRSLVSRIESGERIATPQVIHKLAEALRCTPLALTDTIPSGDDDKAVA